MKKEERIETDVLVIGSGIAGISAAVEAAKNGLKVVVITKEKDVKESNTYHAQGGIVGLTEGDKADLLKEDILRAGDGLSNPKAAEILATEGPGLVENFLAGESKVNFTRSKDGNYDYAQEAGHSKRRILHADDTTGRVIEERMVDLLKNYSNITVMRNHTAVDLLTLPHHSLDPLSIYEEPQCIGAYVLDNEIERVKTIFAHYIVLATGGVGRVFLHTTNPPCARGDGVAMAYRAGARLINMEYIQFHPTSLFHRDADGFLISESIRGEGAKLKTKDGELFMHRYADEGELAPRDVVSRGIYEEMLRRQDNYVLLDLASYAKIDIEKRFPYIYQTCLRFGIDIAKEPIPVVPSAHYCCGGVKVDERGRTSLNNLYAAGEVSCTGMHGANRLASTSLLEGLVWGIRAAKDISNYFESKRNYRLSDIPPWRYPEKEEEVDPALIHQDWLAIKSTMWNYAGVIRTMDRLERARADLEYLKHRIERFYRGARMKDSIVGLRNGIQVALLITYAAINNKMSRGAHHIHG